MNSLRVRGAGLLPSRFLRPRTRCFSPLFSARQASLSPFAALRTRFGRTSSLVAPEVVKDSFSEQYSRPRIIIPGLLVFGIGFFAVTALAVDTGEDSAHWAEELGRLDQWLVSDRPTWKELAALRWRSTRDNWQEGAATLKKNLEVFPAFIGFHVSRLYVIAANSWLWADEGQRAAVAITAVNAGVFVAWCLPRLRPFMSRYFTHDPLSRQSITMLTSCFSHASFVHLAFNSVALFSFALPVAAIMHNFNSVSDDRVQQSTIKYEFIAYFIAAGLAASYVSHVASALKLRIAMRNLLNPAKAPRAMKLIEGIRPSLGSSGAIYAMVTLTALMVPNTNVNIMFIPIAIPIRTAVSGIVMLDVLGIFRGWKMFDHWAHLGGAAFGALVWYDQGHTWNSILSSFREVRLVEEEKRRELEDEEEKDL